MKYLPLIGSAALLLLAATAHSAIVGTTGQCVVIPAPANVSLGVLESDTQICVFAEKQGVILSNAINVDITNPGTSPSATGKNFSDGVISAATAVSSFYTHFDNIGDVNAAYCSGSITFDTDVLGIILTSPNLGGSETEVGFPGTIYDINSVLEINATDKSDEITLSSDRRTVTLNLGCSTGADDVRIITAAVPEPASLSLLALPGMLLLMRRRLTIQSTQ